MSKEQANSDNWIAATIMALRAFKTDAFVDKIEKFAMGERIAGNDIVLFLSSILRNAAERGLVPNSRFSFQFDTDMQGSLKKLKTDAEAEEYMRKKCRLWLLRYCSLDIYRNCAPATCSFDFQEVAPVIRDRKSLFLFHLALQMLPCTHLEHTSSKTQVCYNGISVH